MQRRTFLAAGAAAAVLVPAAAVARTGAGPAGSGRDPWDRSLVQFWRNGRLVRPDSLVLVSTAGTVALDLSQRQPVFPEWRVDTGVSEFFRPTIARRLEGAERIGPVRLAGRSLVVSAGDSTGVAGDVVIAYRKQSWDIEARPKALTGVEMGADAARCEAVGAAFRTATGLLVALTPTFTLAIERS